MNWHNKPFDSLSVCELFEIYKARMAVFVVEQNCAYPEVDDKDLNARHFFAESGGRVAACCRIIPENGAVIVGRVLVAQTARGGGSGRDLMRRALEFARAEYKGWPVLLQAQLYLRDFYASLGFAAVSGEYLEDGIPHIDMALVPSEKTV